MSRYPIVAFPSHTRGYNRENQKLFTDYGCLESVHIDSCQMEAGVFAKKQRPILLSSSASYSTMEPVDQHILVPVHDFITLGIAEPLKNIQGEDIPSDLIRQKKIGYDKRANFGKSVHTITVTDSINNFIDDYPGLAYGKLSWLTVKCAPVEHALAIRKLPNHIDPGLCDVGRQMLWKFAGDEARANLKKHYCNRSRIGGCLSYQCLAHWVDKEIGVLIGPQGQGLDELAVKHIMIDYKELGNDHETTFSVPGIKAGAEIRQKLNGQIQQVNVAPFMSSGSFLLASRSDYHVLLSKFNHLSLDYWEDGKLNISSEDAISSLGLLKTGGRQRICSLALNPYLVEECALTTEDGFIRLWNINVSSQTSGLSLQSLQVLSDNVSLGLQCNDDWTQLCFAAHPRQLYVADDQSVCLFDIRSRKSSLPMLDMKKSYHANKQERIFCLESGRDIDNEYQCIIATDHNIFVMDQRHCGEPMIQLGTNMSYPPQYLKTVRACDGQLGQKFSQLDRVDSTFGMLIGNRQASEVFCYQLCRARTKSPPHVFYPCQCIGPPRRLDGDSSWFNLIKAESAESNKNLKDCSSRTMIGLEATPIHTRHMQRECHGAIVFRMSSWGDIEFQTLLMGRTNTENAAFDVIPDRAFRTISACMETDSVMRLNEWSNTVEGIVKSPKSGKLSAEYQLDSGFPVFEIETNTSPSTKCRLCVTLWNGLCTDCGCKACQTCGVNPMKSATVLKPFIKTGLGLSLNESSEGSDIHAKLDLLDITKQEEFYGNDIGSLLKATWNVSYEEYWESQRTLEEKRRVQVQQHQNRLMLDLDQRDEDGPTKLKTTLLTSDITHPSGCSGSPNLARRKNMHVSSAVDLKAIALSDRFGSEIRRKNANISKTTPQTSRQPFLESFGENMNLASFVTSPLRNLSHSSSPGERKGGNVSLSKTTIGF